MKGIIKSYTYNVIGTDPFEMPLPVEFKLMNGNAHLATYKIHESGQVDYSFNASAKEPVLTSTVRPLELNDIYFLFSSRVFQDKTPFTDIELARFGIEEYNPYYIARKTHGIMPIDRYWIKFSDEEHINYKKASDDFAEYFKPKTAVEEVTPVQSDNEADKMPQKECETIYSLDSIMNQKSHEYTSIHDAGSILNEGKLDVASLYAKVDDKPITESAFAGANTSLKEKPTLVPGINLAGEESDGGRTINPGDEDPNGGMMSPEAIAALLANAGGGDPEPEPAPEPVNAEKEESSGGMMSPEAIAALLAASNPEPEPVAEPEPIAEPEPVKEVKVEKEESSGGNMSPDAIAALLAAAGNE
jgi:hypothetical protein